MTKSVPEQTSRTNAKDSDAFDIFNLRHYVGPNPDLSCEALAFDFAFTGHPKPIPLNDLHSAIAERLPELATQEFQSYQQLFGQTVSAINRLDLNLHMNKLEIQEKEQGARIAFQVVHKTTSWKVVYFVWDWFEYICDPDNNDFDYDAQFSELQDSFNRSVFGGPTSYSLLKAAAKKHIPVTYLWDEGLFQYGYGKNMVRGIATTFDVDSHVDSDFTCRKDDCKAFLAEYGFPVPEGEVVFELEEAIEVAEDIGYPVVCKPVVGHKGIGVTANIENEDQLRKAFLNAIAAVPEGEPQSIIIETFIQGSDHRILCVDGEFVAAVKREPAYIVGDGESTVMELINIENGKEIRADTATSPLGKILTDDVMDNTLEDAGLHRDSVVERGEKVFLRKVANLSLGGVSEDVTDIVHPEIIAMSRAISQHFKLTVFALDVITDDIANDWKPRQGQKRANFGIIEINAAPGIYMHLKPAYGRSIDVPTRIIETFFDESLDARIPILTFNKLSKPGMKRIIDYVMHHDICRYPAGVCTEGMFLKKHEFPVNPDYNANMRNVLRNPRVEMLLAEMPLAVYETEGMYYNSSDLLVLEDPNETEMILAEDMEPGAIVMIRIGNDVEVRRGDKEPEKMQVEFEDEFHSLILHEIKAHFGKKMILQPAPLLGS